MKAENYCKVASDLWAQYAEIVKQLQKLLAQFDAKKMALRAEHEELQERGIQQRAQLMKENLAPKIQLLGHKEESKALWRRRRRKEFIYEKALMKENSRIFARAKPLSFRAEFSRLCCPAQSEWIFWSRISLLISYLWEGLDDLPEEEEPAGHDDEESSNLEDPWDVFLLTFIFLFVID